MPYTYDFPRPAVTTDIAAFALRERRLRVLLIRRKRPPFKGGWALPGGFVEIAEKLEAAAARELLEETGLKAACLDQFRTYGDPHRDPRGRIVTVAYLAAVRADSTARRGGQAAPFGGQAAPFGGQARAASDAAEVRWHDPASPPRMAFDHQTILRDSLAELRRRARYAAMLLAFLPSTFTIAQLKECAEEVMGQPISSRALSRRLRRLHILRRTASRGKYRTVPHAWEIIERCGGLLGESLPRQKTTS